ncbi:MAG: endopeptidase La [Candidatus Omnitrophica bacterium]|nr:endopeptidase La [Candidatus Omnitrophota bacterium]
MDENRIAPQVGPETEQPSLLDAEPLELGEEGHLVLPLRDVVLFPGMVAPLFIGRPKSAIAIEMAAEHDTSLIAVTQKDVGTDNPGPGDLHEVGTLCQVLQLVRLPDGSLKVLLEGLGRRRIHEVSDGGSEDVPMAARSSPMPEEYRPSSRLNASVRYVSELFENYVRLQRKIPKENLLSILSLENPSLLADQIAAHLYVKVEVKQQILAEPRVHRRLSLLASFLEQENDILEIEKKIKDEVRGQMEKSQREYYLAEQIKALQRELGREAEPSDEVEEYRAKLVAAKLPQEVHQRAERELNRLASMAPLSPEATVVRTYLDWIFDLPWHAQTEETLELPLAEKILEEDHYGLKKPKERILEYLAVRKLNPASRGPILCFVGPPGVGKTSLGRSIARATNRRFARISLGGMRDEAEIRGHRRTYIGSLPGRIIQTLRKVGMKNPVILLDEIDKMSADFRGDPSSALLEVLDPEQNCHFSDNYLEVEFDLSRIFFITTANVLHPVPPALRDRMEVIEISSYTEEEKVQIAKRYLVPRAVKETGLSGKSISFTVDGIQEVIRRYTREAGVRNLEREIQSICRKVARGVAADPKKKTKVTVGSGTTRDLLGIPKFIETEKKRSQPDVGIATGLAWTEVGGDLLSIEVAVLEGKGDLALTGQLGQVMQESARAALSFARSRAQQFGIPKEFHRRYDLHVHLPEGAIPKDGPSAGVTLATALISALAGVPARPDVAMTGEITLRGKVLPVGGIKEKVLAAHRAKVAHVLIPEENRKDLEDIPPSILRDIDIRTIRNMDEVLELALASRTGKR